MSAPVHVICLKWGTKFGPEYVNRLYQAIKRNTNVSFLFHCFTDDATNILPEVIIHDLPFKKDLVGWWNKVYLFSDDMPIARGEKIFFVDLDTLITGSIDSLLNHDPSVITVLKDFYTGLAKTVVGHDNIGSGLMSWYHGSYPHIWNEFIRNPTAAIKSVEPHGDQRWIQKLIKSRIYWQDAFPGRVVSFKVHCSQGLPPGAAVVCYHGTPNIPDSATKRNRSWKFVLEPQRWVLDHWRDDVVTNHNEVQNMSRTNYKVRYVVLPARMIFGMVGRSGGGYNTIWTDWSDQGRQRRELIMKEYELAMDHLCGHYTKLEQSVLQEGFRNPVIITCGTPKKRTMEHLPPEWRARPIHELLLLETTMGGSRLYVAQKHNMEIPCIVNDWCNRFSGEPEITNIEEARMCYMDPPKGLSFNPHLGLVESFDQTKVGHHLGPDWSEDRQLPHRAVIWIKIMNKYGYRVDNLPKIVQDILAKAGVDQTSV